MTKLKEKYDVIIIGARVAGSVLASKLGDAGYSVLIIDKDTFPSTTASTHYFRGMSGLRIFNEIGILDELTKVAPKLTHQVDFLGGTDEYVISEAQGSGDLGFNINIRRFLLDDILNKRVLRTPNVSFLDKTKLVDLQIKEDHVSAKIQTETGEYLVISDFIVGADGRNSTVANLVIPEYEFLDDGHRLVVYQYFKKMKTFDNNDPYAAEFSLYEDEVAYLFPIDSQGYLAAISLNKSYLSDVRELTKSGLDHLFRHHPSIKRRVAQGIPDGKSIRVTQKSNYMRIPYGQRWVLIGDAGIHLDPWSGLGIDFATLQANFLAESIIENEERNLNEQFKQFHERRNEKLSKLFYNTVKNSRNLSKLYVTMKEKLIEEIQLTIH